MAAFYSWAARRDLCTNPILKVDSIRVPKTLPRPVPPSMLPAILASAPDRVDIFVRGADNTLSHIARDGATWTDWLSLDGKLAGDPSAIRDGVGLHVYVRHVRASHLPARRAVTRSSIVVMSSSNSVAHEPMRLTMCESLPPMPR